MGKTTIQWTDLSFNPIRARRIDGKQRVSGHYCQKISTGCTHCYSSNFQPRFQMPTFGGTNKTPAESGVEVFLDEEVLKSLLRRKKPAKVFWCDMSDLFGDWVPFEWIDKCFAVMAMTPHLTHQILTKRPERMAEYLGSDPWYVTDRIDDASCHFGACHANLDHRDRWPMPNVWLGTSVENQKSADERIPHLLKCPAAVRFLSCEPLLGPIDLMKTWGKVDGTTVPAAYGVDWAIIGGESGGGARECDLAWINSIRKQCAEAGVPCFVKQLGAAVSNSDPELRTGGITDSKGGDITEFPEALRVRQFPKSFAMPAPVEVVKS